MLTPELDELINQYQPLFDAGLDYSLNIIAAVLILIFGWIAASWASRAVLKRLNKARKIEETIKPVLASLVRYAILVFVIIAVLARFGVQTASIIAVLGAAGLAIGLALQGTLTNIASGVMLLFLQPLKLGEYVDAGGQGGTVKEIGLFTTILETPDGIFISIPNTIIWNDAIKNYSRNSLRRIDLGVGIGYSDDISKAMKVLLNLMSNDERILSMQDYDPQVMVVNLGDSSVDLNLRCWVKSSNYWDTIFDLRHNVKTTLDDNQISIPFPQRDIHLFNASNPN